MATQSLSTTFSPLLDRLRPYLSSTRTPTLLRTILALILSWRTFLFILTITNLKSIPLSWHFRLFYNMFRKGSTVSENRKRVLEAAASLPSSSNSTTTKPLHPIFRPTSLHTRAPLAECDYNLHKSNSTYFSDLDLSRGQLVSNLINPVLRLNAVVPHGVKRGLCYPILGSVHVSFLREIKPYEKYEVRSRVLGWDRKWIIIGSWFVRRATRKEVQKDKISGKRFLKGEEGKEEVVFACVLNKYVVKSGRMTVPPELCFAGSGWFPVREHATASIRAWKNGGGVVSASGTGTETGTGTGMGTPTLGPEKVVDRAANAVQDVAIEAGRRLSLSGTDSVQKASSSDAKGEELPGWSWDEIEAERQRGLKIAERWLNLDVELRAEYEEDVDRGTLLIDLLQ